MSEGADWCDARTSVKRRRRTVRILRWAAVLVTASTVRGLPTALGQQRAVPSKSVGGDSADAERRRFTSEADSLGWKAARSLAGKAEGFRVVVSMFDRHLWAIMGIDTLLSAPVGVASGASLDYQGRQWSFRTPRGRRVVVAKDSFPAWVPPEWHYYEVARNRGLVVRKLVAGQPVALDDGRLLEVRADLVGVVGPDSAFAPLPVGDEIILDGFLFIPPLGTQQRRIPGILGSYRLDLGGGYLLHGTPDIKSIGEAATHGCVRLGDDAIAWLYTFVPVGTRVYIY